MRTLVAWRMRDGGKISFWFDMWLPAGALITVLGKNFIMKVDSAPDITVKYLYESNIWRTFTRDAKNRYIRHLKPFLRQLASMIPKQCPASPLAHDRVVWKLSTSGKFSTKFAWNAI